MKFREFFLETPRRWAHISPSFKPTYPFNFELEVDMDGSIVRRYGVKTFPSAVIERGGKRIIVTRADELEEKLNKER